MEASKH